jgi:kynurenine formamidase
VGIDTPSIDLFDDKKLLAHTAVARGDLAVLEGLVLDGVAPGAYTLIALPLPIEGADASPVRAVLLPAGCSLGEPMDTQGNACCPADRAGSDASAR